MWRFALCVSIRMSATIVWLFAAPGLYAQADDVLCRGLKKNSDVGVGADDRSDQRHRGALQLWRLDRRPDRRRRDIGRRKITHSARLRN